MAADPLPVAHFEGFGDNSLALSLRAFLDSVDYRLSTRAELHKAINEKFARTGIIIAFAQCDLHLNEPVRVKLEDDRADR